MEFIYHATAGTYAGADWEVSRIDDAGSTPIPSAEGALPGTAAVPEGLRQAEAQHCAPAGTISRSHQPVDGILKVEHI